MHKFRKATNEDYPSIICLHKAGLKESDSYIENSSLDSDLENIELNYTTNGHYFLVNDGPDIVCMGAMLIKGKVGELKRIRVSSTVRRQGYGGAISDELILLAKGRGCRRIILDTGENQVGAIAMYERIGFREYDREKIEGLNSILMELSI